jgi:hypothetical protein
METMSVRREAMFSWKLRSGLQAGGPAGQADAIFGVPVHVGYLGQPAVLGVDQKRLELTVDLKGTS